MSGNDEGKREAGVLPGLKTLAKSVGAIFRTSATPSQSNAAAEKNPPVKVRARDEETQSGTAHLGGGTLLATCALLVAFAAGVWFLVAYWSDASNQTLGVTLAICLGGFGIAAVLWAHLLMEQKEATDPREELPSSQVEREAAEESLCAGASGIQRRRLLKFAVAGCVGLFAAMVISLLRSLVGPTDPALFGIVWKRGQRLMKVDGTPVSIHTLRDGDTTIVFPEGSVGDERAQTVLIRVKEQLLQLPEDRADWAPLGYVAYSRVCTHAGCPVGIFEPTTHLLLCPCHQSTFDVLKAATPTGGPAARPLPQLPLYAESDGTLRAAGSFSHRPGPGFWGMK